MSEQFKITENVYELLVKEKRQRRRLEEQNGTLQAHVKEQDKELAAAWERVRRAEEQLEAAEDHIAALVDLIKVSVGFWVATPQELIEAQHRVPHRDKLILIKAIMDEASTPASEPEAGPFTDAQVDEKERRDYWRDRMNQVF